MTVKEARPTALERACAIAIPRAMLGLVYLFAGVHKLTDGGFAEYGRQFAQSEAARFMPGALLLAAGAATPFLELSLGALLLVGLWTRPALRLLAVLIILIAMSYGIHGLLHPVGATAMNVSVVNFYILPRAALLMLVFFLPRDDDWATLDAYLNRRRGARR